MSTAQAQRQHIDTILSSLDSLPGASDDAVIERSWRRCIDRYGLDPARPSPPRYVPDRTLREHQDQADALIQVGRAGVEQLYRQVVPLGYVVLLTDARGIAVQFLGANCDQREHQRTGLYLGSDWSEEHAGTCAVGTCIHERIPLTCHHTDHFSAHHIRLTCTAAPIFDPHGQLLAILDISAYHSPESKTSQTFALQLVKHYARMIENAYFLQRYNDHHVVCLDRSREFVQINRRYLIAIEVDGTLVAANTAGRKLLRHHDLPLPGPGEARPFKAWNIQDLLDAEIEDVLTIQRYCDDRVRAFRTHRHREIHFATLIEPQRRTTHAASEGRARDTSLAPLEALADDDPAMRDTLTRAARLRNEPINILVIGETGTGKERMARALHESSRRRDKPFVAINCAAMPESLIESELFGYEPGSFTGARSKGMKGLIAQADGGTLFLDEIGDMPLQLQTRLLRVLAEQEVLPIGASRPLKVDLRVVAATHRDLRSLIAEGRFREDLFYRLNGASLRLPPLRERADKSYLIRRIFEELQQKRDERTRLRGDAMSALLAYPWPGNIRELHNALRYALATCDGNEVIVDDLPEECVSGHLAHPGAHRGESASALDAPSRVVDLPGNRDPLHQALRRHHWNISAVARELGLSRPTIYRRMKRLGIVPPQQRDTL
ncbi:sigma-54-dependent Fis family transcriptional regulator [Litchfieldella qijiaojingensis]|uniref:Sigma-54-dependent Fis family transcriptional regulator n=1 Tax=Litchfieldella qijiaojingensis TaxID=980347 RepID=A0ABQ2Z546_9GAMM|nr:sigma-54-dependent Fis family transcriptional regulator [Halomonas qijiaojingensis]GGY01616.1 sigma-54-dependent Fis family transcriptional regulator [Halomonas qijiaojingensis]